MTVRVMLVDDQELMRQGLRKLLEIEDGIEVVGEAADGIEALDLLPELAPQVVLVDARMPRMDGVALIDRLTREHPAIVAIVLTTFDEDEYIFGALRAGARGYLLKDTSPDDLVVAIRKASAGETILDSPVAARLVAQVCQAPNRFPAEQDVLSTRELEVARLVGAGSTNREIAARLFITEGTVKNHVSAALRKLGLRDRTQLALRYAATPRD